MNCGITSYLYDGARVAAINRGQAQQPRWLDAYSRNMSLSEAAISTLVHEMTDAMGNCIQFVSYPSAEARAAATAATMRAAGATIGMGMPLFANVSAPRYRRMKFLELCHSHVDKGDLAGMLELGLRCLVGYKVLDDDLNLTTRAPWSALHSPKKGLEWLELALQRGHLPALLFLGRVFLRGVGCPPDRSLEVREDVSRALSYFTRAASECEGVVAAEAHLGAALMVEESTLLLEGVDKRLSVATELMRDRAREHIAKAASLGVEPRSCMRCDSSDVALQMCSRCRSAVFCSPACQRAAWRRHKLFCSAPAADNGCRKAADATTALP